MGLSSLVNKVVEVGTLGLVDDITGTEAAGRSAKDAAGLQSVASIKASEGLSEASLGAGQLQVDANTAAENELRRQFQATRGQLTPFRNAAIPALQEQQALLGLSDEVSQQQAFANLQESPGQRFIREKQQRALLRNSAAIGGLGGGNVRTALQQQAAGFAQQDLENRFARLGQLTGQGLNATTNIGQFGAQSSGGIANLLQQSGQAKASGLMNSGQAIARGITGESQAQASGILGAQQSAAASDGQLLGLLGTVAGAAAGAGAFGGGPAAPVGALGTGTVGSGSKLLLGG
jgi:hypothetical protein